VTRELAVLKDSISISNPIASRLGSNIRIERISPDYRIRDDRRLDGLLSWLSHSNGGQNVEDLGLVRVITDGPGYDDHYFGKHILDVRTDTAFLSQTSDVPGKWIGYDFGELIRILPTHYSIRSNCNGRNSCHLRSWVIEVSNDPSPNSTWRTIDERQSREELNGRYNVGLFSVSTRLNEDYRCIRIRSTGPNWCSDHRLYLSGLELFGELRLCESIAE
jgi:hypothetical protein